MERTSLSWAVGCALGMFFCSGTASAMLHPVQNRFIQRDPVGYTGSKSLYEYLRSVGLVFRDPSGMAPGDAERTARAMEWVDWGESGVKDYDSAYYDPPDFNVPRSPAGTEGIKDYLDDMMANTTTFEWPELRQEFQSTVEELDGKEDAAGCPCYYVIVRRLGTRKIVEAAFSHADVVYIVAHNIPMDAKEYPSTIPMVNEKGENYFVDPADLHPKKNDAVKRVVFSGCDSDEISDRFSLQNDDAIPSEPTSKGVVSTQAAINNMINHLSGFKDVGKGCSDKKVYPKKIAVIIGTGME